MSELLRKVWHASSGVVLALAIYCISPNFFQSFAICAIYGLILVHTLKKKGYKIPVIDDYIGSFGRGKELGDNSLYFILGAFISSLFFSKIIAAVSVLILGFSDAVATLVGKKFGKHELYKSKTLEGSLAFFISTFLIVSYFFGLIPGLIAGVVLALIELFGGSYDNLLIPVAGSLIIQLSLML